MATEHTQVSSYGPISARMQVTQTLPVHTQPSTQLLSHEVPQFTQLVDHDSVEHVHGDTLVNSSYLEGPGNTLVLHDDASLVRSKAGSSPIDKKDDAHVKSQAAPPLQAGVLRKNELHIGVTAEDCGKINTPALDPPKKYITPNLPDSDATTEEADIGGFGLLAEEADAESLLHTTVDTKGDVAPDNLAEQSTPSATLAAGVPNMKSSQSRPTSVQTVPLCALGPLAANQNASLDLARKDDAKFDSSATVELTPEVLNSELKDPFQAPDGTLGPPEGPSTDKAAGLDSVQSLPDAVLPPTDATMRSPHMFTSAFLSPQQALEPDSTGDRIDTNESDKNTSEGLSSYGRAPEMPIDHPESMPTPLEPLSAGSKRQHSQEPTKKLDQDSRTNIASPGISKTKQPSSQNAKDAVTDKLTDAENAVSEAMETEGKNVSGNFVSVTHAPVREQRLSLASGFHAAPINLSYLESQEPGEETQMNAFNMVDKLVWLDTTCMPDDIVTSPAPQDSSIKDHASAKGLRPLAQAAQMKTVRDKLDVFDWKDSQVDQVYTPPVAKQKPVNVGSRKRQSEVHKPIAKKQATSDQKRKAITSQIVNNGNDSTTSAEKEKITLDVAKTQMPNLELSKSSPEKKPHTLLTTRLRNRTKAESRPLAKGRKGSSLKRGPSKRAGKGRESDEFGKDFEAAHQKGSDNIKVTVHQAGLNAKDESGKRAGRKKAVNESGKDLKAERLNANDNMKVEMQESGPGAKSEARKRAGGKKAVDEAGKDLKIKQLNGSDNKGKKSLQAASVSAKGKEELKVSPEGRGSVGLAERTSQDDAAADIWIEAFASAKNKTPPKSSDVELIKFRKRNAVHEDTEMDSKKRRIIEASTVDAFETKEAPLKEDRVEAEKSQRDLKKAENIHAVKISRHGGRRVGTRRHSQDENQELVKKDNNLMKENQLTTKLQRPRTDDTQVKTRRISTRSSGEKHEDAPIREDILMKENKAELGLKTRQDQKQCKTADVMIMPSTESKRVSTRSSKQENLNIIEQAGNAKNDSTLERGRKTRSRDQRAKSIVAGNDVEEGNRVKNDVNKSICAQATTNDKDEQSLPCKAMQGDVVVVKPSFKTRRSKQKESLFSQQHSTGELNQDAKGIETGPCQAGPSPIDVNEGVPAEGPKRRSRRGEADARVLKSAKAVGKSVPQPKEDTDKSTLKTEESMGSKKGDVSKPTMLRRTRRNTHDDGSQKTDVNKDKGQFCGESTTEEQTSQNYNGILDDNKGLKEDAKKSETTTKSVLRRSKKTSAPERVEKLDSSDRGKRRKTEPGCIRVLFSHSLREDIIKHQKKILAKLGGQLATSASDCTHFVSNFFVRTQNMLISMAAGKIVATLLWLEDCGQANYFVDARKYILQDEKKEKELGFSMIASLASAKRKPLLKGVQVLVCPNTVPEPEVLRAIVENAGGQVMDIKSSSSLLDVKESDILSVIIANEKDFDFCFQFLDKGLKVYSEELLLHGIVTQSLDFSRHHLFEDFKHRQSRGRAAKISA